LKGAAGWQTEFRVLPEVVVDDGDAVDHTDGVVCALEGTGGYGEIVVGQYAGSVRCEGIGEFHEHGYAGGPCPGYPIVQESVRGVFAGCDWLKVHTNDSRRKIILC